MEKGTIDRASSLFWMVVALGICFGSLRLGIGHLHKPGPGFFSFLAGSALCILSVSLFLRSSKARGSSGERKGGVGYQEFEDVVRSITTDHFGPVKTEISLKSGLEKLGRLDPVHDEMMAENLHELMRAHEAMNIQQVAKITASAALERKETRFQPYHYRADYPETDDKYCGLIVVRKGEEGRVVTRFEPLFY